VMRALSTETEALGFKTQLVYEPKTLCVHPAVNWYSTPSRPGKDEGNEEEKWCLASVTQLLLEAVFLAATSHTATDSGTLIVFITTYSYLETKLKEAIPLTGSEGRASSSSGSGSFIATALRSGNFSITTELWLGNSLVDVKVIRVVVSPTEVSVMISKKIGHKVPFPNDTAKLHWVCCMVCWVFVGALVIRV